MTFREKSAALTLLVLLGMYGAYGIWLFQHPRSIGEVLGALIGGVVLLVLVSIVGAIVLAIYGAVRGEHDEAVDERDRRVGQKSARNAYWVVLSLIWAIPVLALLAPRAATANAVLLTLGLAEIVHYGSRLYYYRWGA